MRWLFLQPIHPDNPELIAAKIKNIPVLHRSDVLAGLLNKAKGIAIAGAHGKSTTSAMTAVILAENNADPTIVIGGEVASVSMAILAMVTASM
jgi:UDP-N-acetylmuramate--alanine ligase